MYVTARSGRALDPSSVRGVTPRTYHCSGCYAVIPEGEQVELATDCIMNECDHTPPEKCRRSMIYAHVECVAIVKGEKKHVQM